MNISSASTELALATFRTQAMGALFSPGKNDQSFLSIFAGQIQELDGLSNGFSVTPNVASLNGRNMALFDPESAYRMMSDINGRDVSYKAQYAELSEMDKMLQGMEDAGNLLEKTDMASSDQVLRDSLRTFVDQYNQWIDRFDEDLGKNGLLSATRAAQMAQYELEQSVEFRFNGAAKGMYGLGELGISIDDNTHLASLDMEKLNAAMAGNRPGVIQALQEFGANFSQSADLLTSEGNFVPSQLDNLQRAISFIKQNLEDWRQEFGTGDAAKPNPQVAQALSLYRQNYAA